MFDVRQLPLEDAPGPVRMPERQEGPGRDVMARLVQALSADSSSLVFAPPAARESPMERAYKQEKAAFERLHPALRREYEGQYVAVHNGRVVDADPDRLTLVRRFFDRHGDVSVFIGYVGRRQRPSRAVTPFRR